MSEGFQLGGEDEAIDLSFGPDTVTPSEFGPADEGMYKLLLTEPPDVVPTKRGEKMLKFKFTIVGPGFQGKPVNDNAVIPDDARRQEFGTSGDSKWNIMMNMLCEKLEALTGESWRQDNVRLVPKELSGHSIIAKLRITEREYVPVKDNPEGKSKMGRFNEIEGRWRVDDGSLDAAITDRELRQTTGTGSQSQSEAFKL